MSPAAAGMDNPAARFVMPGGKHAGKALGNIPHAYLLSLLQSDRESTPRIVLLEVERYVEACAEFNGKPRVPASPPPPPQTKEEWRRRTPWPGEPRERGSRLDTPNGDATGSVLWFGRFKGRRLATVPDSYLRFLHGHDIRDAPPGFTVAVDAEVLRRCRAANTRAKG